MGFAFQSNLLEGVRVDLDRMMRAADAINALLQGPTSGRRNVEPAPVCSPATQRDEPVAPPNVFQPEPMRLRISPVLSTASPAAAAPSSSPAVQPFAARTSPTKERRASARAAAARPATAEEERLADDAFAAAARVFESGRHQDAENAWKAIIRRWPNSEAALKSRRILKNRRRDSANS
jgi:TolA-binding protein